MGTVVGRAVRHDSAAGHVRGDAAYVDDLPVLANTLHAAFGLSAVAHGELRRLDLDRVRACPGVVAVIAHADVPGDPNIGPVFADEDLFAAGKVMYHGQALFAVAATTEDAARRAARLPVADVRELPPVLTIEAALAKRQYVVPRTQLPRLERGWDPTKLAGSAQRRKGEVRCGGQEHFYLEGQVAYAMPQEEGRMLVHSSSQNPSEIQHLVAGALGRGLAEVEVRVQRMGGGFGGKETQASFPAVAAAVLAARTGRPVKLRLPRADDFLLTGKRHPFLGRYEMGFDKTGRILAADLALAADCGCSADLSTAVLDRALLHSDNAYHLPCVRVRGYPCRTNKVSNTAFRGFGGPQGMMLIERVVDDIARHLGMDPLDVRQRNLYRNRRQRTPYGQEVSDNILPDLVARLERTSGYRRRRAAVAAANRGQELVRHGLALTPVKFGISFTASFYNQAGALVQLYRDGTVTVAHAGTEMGQGLHVKVAQVVADGLGLPLEAVQVDTTSTAKVPNTAPTAASAGSDLNGMAAANATAELRGRLAKVAAATWGVKPAAVSFADGQVQAGKQAMSLKELSHQAYMARVPLAARGFYATPDIHWDRARFQGRPFYYFAYGAAVAEVAVDILTGEHRLTQVDIIHDVGASLNPAVDRGQVVGGFAQGYGWLTSEELSWDGAGRPLVVGPATYKIPAVGTMPADFNVELWDAPARVATINRSKGVGEPPLMLALAGWQALVDAVSAARGGGPVRLDAPATPERVLLAIQGD